MITSLLLLAAPAWSNPLERVTSIREDGSVVMSVLVEKPVAAVQSSLGSAMSRFSLDAGRTITDTVQRGECQELHVEAPGLLSPMRYISLRCPTADGYSETLVSSDDFDASEVQWTLTRVEGGTRITYRVLVDLDMPVSDSMLQSRVKKNMAAVMDRFMEHL